MTKREFIAKHYGREFSSIEVYSSDIESVIQDEIEKRMQSEAMVRYGKEYSEMSDEELKENHIVKIKDSDMIWNVIPSISPRKDGKELLIRLEWGMFEPYFIDTNANMAQSLIHSLTDVINQIKTTEK